MRSVLHVGLGDVAVPGLLACLALRFDAVRLLQPGQAAGTELPAQVRCCTITGSTFLRVPINAKCSQG